jgi:hypothetical protein
VTLLVTNYEIPNRIDIRPVRLFKTHLHHKPLVSFHYLANYLTANRLHRIEHVRGIEAMPRNGVAPNSYA